MYNGRLMADAPKSETVTVANQDLAWMFLRGGVAAALFLIVVAVPAALISWGLLLVVLFVAGAALCFADCAASRLSGTQKLLPPRAALMGIYGFVGLAVAVLIASL